MVGSTITLSEALQLRAAKRRTGAMQAAQWVMIGGAALSGDIDKVLGAQMRGRALTIEEEYGQEVADSERRIRERQRDFVEATNG